VEIKPGFHVVDYGCGPGAYTGSLAELVGEAGKIYALDINPLAIEKVRTLALRRQFLNVEAILSECETGLPDAGVDVVLLYDTFHHLDKPDKVLEELHRILKGKGILSFSDHHMKEKDIISQVENRGLFKLAMKGKKTYTFSKVPGE
jgi:ubiquinone/menaquinone biosynthesis C-methylase UbiE